MSALRRLQSWEGFLIAVLLFVVLINASVSPQFLSTGNLVNLFQLSIEKAIVALAMTLVIVNAEIDLSVGSMLGLSACAFGYMHEAGVDARMAVAFCLLIGLAGGLLNGVSTAWLGLPSL